MSDDLPLVGSAPEILQARVRAAKGLPLTDIPAAVADAPGSVQMLPEPEVVETEESLASALPDPETNPFVKHLDTLPDEDLKKLAYAKGIAYDGRWGRDKIMAALIAAASAPATPPPAAVVETSNTATVVASQTVPPAASPAPEPVVPAVVATTPPPAV